MKISKPRMFLKFIRLFFYRVIKRKWYLPTVSEITVDQLFDRMNSKPLLIDLRGEDEFNGNGQNSVKSMTIFGHIENAKRMGIMELSSNLDDLHTEYQDKEIITICPGGGMSLVAVEIMVKAGFKDVKSLKGGIVEWYKRGFPLIITAEDSKPEPLKEEATIIEVAQPPDENSMSEVHHTLDVRNFVCPIPILKSRKKLMTLMIGQVLEILTTDPGSLHDIPAWANVSGQELLVSEKCGSEGFRFLVKRMK